MHRVAQVGLAAVLLASCSSSARHAATTASSTTRTAIVVAPSATLHITGDRELAGDVVDASVVCCFNSGQLSGIGITRAGNENVQFLISLGSDGLINVEEAPAHAVQHYYGSVSGLATLTSNGGRAHGDVVERKATPPHTLHIE